MRERARKLFFFLVLLLLLLLSLISQSEGKKLSPLSPFVLLSPSTPLLLTTAGQLPLSLPRRALRRRRRDGNFPVDSCAPVAGPGDRLRPRDPALALGPPADVEDGHARLHGPGGHPAELRGAGGLLGKGQRRERDIFSFLCGFSFSLSFFLSLTFSSLLFSPLLFPLYLSPPSVRRHGNLPALDRWEKILRPSEKR